MSLGWTAALRAGQGTGQPPLEVPTFPSEEWALPLLVRYDGRVIGVPGAAAVSYTVLRTPDTFSWLAESVHG